MATWGFTVYVIQLKKTVLWNARFRQANPNYRDGKACLYVGMTGRTAEERFEQHLAGYKASRYVKKYGKRLRPDLYPTTERISYEEACELERQTAENLRARGFGVWSN